MEVQNSTDEITFGHLAKGIRHLYHAFLIRLYKFVQFIYKNWIVLLILILLGFGIGYFLNSQKQPDKEAHIIAQLNYSSVPIIYDAVKQLNEKIKNNDPEFLTSHDLYKNGHSLLKEITITPVVNLDQLIKHYQTNPRESEIAKSLINEATKENDEILTSELFRSQYKLHEITVSATAEADRSAVENIVKYLNDNESLRAVQKVYQKSLQFKIREYELNIAQMDSIFERLGDQNSLITSGTNPISLYDGRPLSFEDLHHTIREKRRLMDDLEEMQADAVKYDNAAVVLNSPEWTMDSQSFFERILWIPVIFVVAYLLLASMAAGIKKGKRLAEQKKQQ